MEENDEIEHEKILDWVIQEIDLILEKKDIGKDDVNSLIYQLSERINIENPVELEWEEKDDDLPF